MTPIVVKDILSEKELRNAKDCLPMSEIEVHKEYGRIMYHGTEWSQAMLHSVCTKMSEIVGEKLTLTGASAVTYNAEHGRPDLPPHFDGDMTDYILDFQLESNTQWRIGLDEAVYPLEDGEGLLFQPNVNAHWREHKHFFPGEFVTMVFFRFHKPERTDYSHMRLSRMDPVFDKPKAFRDGLLKG